MNAPEFAIAGRPIGPDHPPYIVAELSANHLGGIDRAMALIDAAKAAGADAVKLQTYTADTITIDHDGPGFRIHGGLWDGRTLYDLYREAHTPWNWHGPLFAHGRDIGIAVFSSPFDFTAIDLLESLDAPAYKIASFECIDLPLIRAAAATGKPLVMSTGMADLDEIAAAVATARGAGAAGLVLLHCVSEYPASPDVYNLRTIADLGARFDAIPGLSDHTLGSATAIAAVAQGACLIEKHLTMARADGGPDAAFSAEPDELAELVAGCRSAWAALGRVSYERGAAERGNRQFRRSLYAVAEIAAGAALTPENVRSIRPGHGLPPADYDRVLGRRARNTIARGTPLSWDLID